MGPASLTGPPGGGARGAFASCRPGDGDHRYGPAYAGNHFQYAGVHPTAHKLPTDVAPKQRQATKSLLKGGGDDGTRTHDPLLAKHRQGFTGSLDDAFGLLSALVGPGRTTLVECELHTQLHTPPPSFLTCDSGSRWRATRGPLWALTQYLRAAD